MPRSPGYVWGPCSGPLLGLVRNGMDDPGPLDLLGIQHRESPNIPQVAKEPAKAGQEAADRDRPKTGIHEVPFI